MLFLWFIIVCRYYNTCYLLIFYFLPEIIFGFGCTLICTTYRWCWKQHVQYRNINKLANLAHFSYLFPKHMRNEQKYTGINCKPKEAGPFLHYILSRSNTAWYLLAGSMCKHEQFQYLFCILSVVIQFFEIFVKVDLCEALLK